VLINFVFFWAGLALAVNFQLVLLAALCSLNFWFAFLPTLSATSRRLHDAGFSAWFTLLGLIPFTVLFFQSLASEDIWYFWELLIPLDLVCFAVFSGLLVLLCMPTKAQNNKYLK
jgi:uncharacterized membrane protein YhaH (DUF805 family)